jgi:hypothetical protein
MTSCGYEHIVPLSRAPPLAQTLTMRASVRRARERCVQSITVSPQPMLSTERVCAHTHAHALLPALTRTCIHRHAQSHHDQHNKSCRHVATPPNEEGRARTRDGGWAHEKVMHDKGARKKKVQNGSW